MRVTSRKSRVRESRMPGSVRAEPYCRATRPRSLPERDHGLVSQWERGQKHPQGSSLKLLSLVARGGLTTVA